MQSTDEGSQSPASRAGYGETVFRSVGWPVTRWFFVRVWLAYVLITAAFALAIEWSFWRDPIFVGFVLFFPMLAPMMMTRSAKGEIQVTNEGITLKGGRTARYSWEDIVSVRLTSISEGGPVTIALWRFLGADVNRRFMEIKLRRSVRFNPISENMSTRGLGIPSFMKVAKLYPDDPPALLAATEIHLQSGIH
jgi:hypothetical protein